MKYQEFLETIKNNKVHNLTDYEKEVELEVEEPHYLLSTSGSVKKKYYIFSLSDIERSVSSFLDLHSLNREDRWWVSLSSEHVAGFSILARSYFSSIKPPYQAPFLLDTEIMKQEKITMLSLVPTQIYDLVRQKLKCPHGIKTVFVGGARLSAKLYAEAEKLGWPLVPCFGSTETFAQFASSKENNLYVPYKDWNISQNESKELLVRGPSLYSYELLPDTHELKPRVDDYINLKDRVDVFQEGFVFIEKSDGRYKSKGHYKSFLDQKNALEQALLQNNFNAHEAFLLLLEEERSGAGLYLISSNLEAVDKAFKEVSDIRGAFLFEDLNFLLSELKKPLKSKIEDVLARPLLLS